MKNLTLLAVVTALAMASGSSAGDAKKDLELLQGNWKVLSVKESSDAKPRPDDSIKSIAINVKGDVMKITSKGDPVVTYKIKLDASKNPKTIDCVHEGDAKDVNKGKSEPGIYKIEGDTLTICSNAIGQERPSAFATKDKTRMQLVVLQKVK